MDATLVRGPGEVVQVPASDADPTRRRTGHRPGLLRALAGSDLGLLVVLVLFAGGLRAWQLGHTVVTSRDSLSYIRCAWELEHRPWGEVLRETKRHPGFPLAVLAMSQPVRWLMGGPDAVVMQWSAQLASALASVLLVVPMFYLGRELFDRAVGLGTALLFQCLPSASRVMADGLSEALFLLLAALALLAAARGLRNGQPWQFALCGVFGGLAYLTRPEGVLVVAAAGMVLLAGQLGLAWRRPWRTVVACGLALTISTLVVSGPYVAMIGRLTVKPTGKAILESSNTSVSRPVAPSAEEKSRAIWGEGGVWRGLGAIGAEIVEGFFYVACLPALLGLWWYRGRFRSSPGAWVMAVVCVVLMAVLWRVAAVFGYVSDRHLLLVILCGSFPAAAALRELPRRLAVLASSLPGLVRRPVLLLVENRFALVLPTLLIIGVALPKSLPALNADRAGFRAAGLWLAEHAAPGDPLVDPYKWPSYYAGRMLAPPAEGGRTRFVVLQEPVRRDMVHPPTARAMRLATRGEEVFRAPVSDRRSRLGEVVVYAVPESATP